MLGRFIGGGGGGFYSHLSVILLRVALFWAVHILQNFFFCLGGGGGGISTFVALSGLRPRGSTNDYWIIGSPSARMSGLFIPGLAAASRPVGHKLASS